MIWLDAAKHPGRQTPVQRRRSYFGFGFLTANLAARAALSAPVDRTFGHSLDFTGGADSPIATSRRMASGRVRPSSACPAIQLFRLARGASRIRTPMTGPVPVDTG